ncbi:hypothetical protein [Flavobacterium caseinilyticum]|uniref:Uncharacterized protein n=1 Tax=Flavobacterium caseinilyticum TaxID=2541732 RepID=A0A4R5B278_9FLAO|nr:hypothetical protein [Flavobacterium caseinilyticum]TDD77142.1 hypothetical protein E0F89_05960 [Flavobacterium caseinilyticum]
MDISLFLTKLAKPFISFIKELGVIFLKCEKWWISKSESTKQNGRWTLILLVVIGVFSLKIMEYENDETAYILRSDRNVIMAEKKVNFWQFRYLLMVEKQIKDLQAVEQVTDKNKEQIKEINE